MLKLIAAITLMLALTGCGSMVRTSTTTFHGPDHNVRGKIIVMPIDKSQENSLEFANVSAFLMKRLATKGYGAAPSLDESEFVAFITYGVDNGTIRTSTVPIFGQTGGSTSYSTGSLTNSVGRTATFTGSTTTMPTYGVVGAELDQETEYKRRVNIDIWRRDVIAVKVYEMKGLSSGRCGNVNAVLLSIVDGMFRSFPGESGRTETAVTDWGGKC
jgi:hypothetical protein